MGLQNTCDKRTSAHHDRGLASFAPLLGRQLVLGPRRRAAHEGETGGTPGHAGRAAAVELERFLIFEGLQDRGRRRQAGYEAGGLFVCWSEKVGKKSTRGI